MAIEKVKIAAKAAQPIWKIIRVKLLILNIPEFQNLFINSKLKLISHEINLLNYNIKLNINNFGKISIKS